MKITRQQLRRLIKEAIPSPDWSTINDANQQWGQGKKSMSDSSGYESGVPSQQYKAKVAAALVKNALFLKEQGVPGDHKVGIIKNEGGYFLPLVFGTIDDVLAARSLDWFEEAIYDWHWNRATHHNIQIQLFNDDAVNDLDGITQADTPFYSLGRVSA